MIQIKKPENLDGQAIIDFLKENDINVIGYPFLDGNGNLFVKVEKAQESKTVLLMDSYL
jgi:hypothetical protein